MRKMTVSLAFAATAALVTAAAMSAAFHSNSVYEAKDLQRRTGRVGI